MFILRALDRTGSEFFYTGRADRGWVSPNISDAFTYEIEEGARGRAMRFNLDMPLHGLWFIAKDLTP